jgi:hypothetical protein
LDDLRILKLKKIYRSEDEEGHTKIYLRNLRKIKKNHFFEVLSTKRSIIVRESFVREGSKPDSGSLR